MLVLRFFRIGKKNQPSFKIVVTDKKNPPHAGRFVEEVGFYNPVTKLTVIKKERVEYWISKGVQPSPTAYNLFVKEGILEGKKIAVHKKSKKTQATTSTVAAPAAPVAPPAPQAAPVAPVEPATKVEEAAKPEK